MWLPTKTIFRDTLVTRILLGVVLVLFTATTLWAAEDAKRILALIDYIGGDYRNAVQGGKVINADEYQEMTEFSARSLDLFGQLKAKEGTDKAAIEKELRALALHVKQKSGEDAVLRDDGGIKWAMVEDQASHTRRCRDEAQRHGLVCGSATRE